MCLTDQPKRLRRCFQLWTSARKMAAPRGEDGRMPNQRIGERIGELTVCWEPTIARGNARGSHSHAELRRLIEGGSAIAEKYLPLWIRLDCLPMRRARRAFDRASDPGRNPAAVKIARLG